MEQKRETWVDLLKGIAIICVIAGHIIGGLEESGIRVEWGNRLRTFFYAFHMPMIFICSGYLAGKTQIDKNRVSLLTLVKKNVFALYVPYLWSIYLWWVIKMFLYKGNEAVEFNEIYTNLFSGRSSFWFLLALLLIKVLHDFCDYYVPKMELLFWITVFGIATVSYLYVGSIWKLLYWLSYGIYFIAGYQLKKWDICNKLEKINLTYIFWGVVLILIGYMLPGEVNCIYKKFFTGMGITFLFYMLTVKYKLRSKTVEFIGKNSMVFYLLHLFVSPLIRVVLLKMNVTSYTMQLLIGIIICLLTSMVCITLYGRYTFFAWIQYFFYPGRLINKKVNT